MQGHRFRVPIKKEQPRDRQRDPDYRRLLAGIQEAKAHLEAITRFNMPQYRPEPEYIREMKRYGILPQSHQANDPIDVYDTDRRYWQSLWPQPISEN